MSCLSLAIQSDIRDPVVEVSIKPSKAAAVKGMSLMSKGGKNKSLEDALYKEDKLAPVMVASGKAASADSGPPPPVAPLIQHPVMLVIAEKVSAKMTREGVIDSFDVKGSLTLTALDDESANCGVQLKLGDTGEFVFNTHPKVNKPLYDKSYLVQLKDTSKGFPSERPVGILRWTYACTNDDLVPLKINCWPEEESRGQMNVSIEYTLEKSMDLHDVRIRIPLGTSDSPTILSVDGSHRYNSQTCELIWELQLIDRSNSTGSLEFTISQKTSDAFFPITVQFSSQQLFCPVDVVSVNSVETGAPIKYGLTKGMSTEEYSIE
jgi:coatomer subunit delta